MVFSSMVFLFVFLPIIIVGYYGILQKQEHRNIFLLLSSLVFYAWGEPIYIFLMLLSICVNFKIGLMIDSSQNLKKNTLACGVFFNLVFLFLFKYEGFFSTYFNILLANSFPIRFTSLNLSLPIGISFFTFQAISYLVDVYRKDVPVQKSILNLGLYISFFPQLVAGPIVRYRTISQEIENRVTTYDQFTQGVKRLIIGLAKKILFANQLSLIVISAFSQENPSISFAWLGAICYSLQIYYDFSGYSDMAIGLGKMFGFNFSENFNYPYISKTITEFWRRWHISLGSWFRDYVYFPLGGSKVSKPRMIFNLFMVWSLTGFWHGAALCYLAWGILYFFLLTFEKLVNIEKYLKNRFVSELYRVFSLVMIVFGMVVFGCGSLRSSFSYLKIMFGFGYNQALIDNNFIKNINNDGVLVILSIIMATPLLSCFAKWFYQKGITFFKDNTKKFIIFYEYSSTLLYLMVFFVSISYLVMDAHNPFIYFNF